MIWRDMLWSSHTVRRGGFGSFFTVIVLWAACLAFLLTGLAQAAGTKKILFIAGPPSHGPGEHEHRAGCLLLQSCLEHVPGVTSVVYSNGWPEDAEGRLAGAATIVIYSDGGEGHPLLRDHRLETLARAIKQGAGLVCIHYAVEPTKARGEKEFLDWMGGCFETDWSVNPTWTADYRILPQHPITRGVNPFKIQDEWYFHMRFRDGMEGVTPILSAVAPPSTMDRGDGPHEGNPAVRESVKNGETQHMAWAFERSDGGRGFGFTGGHYHRSWGNNDLRKLVLNAILWTAKVEVPNDGVTSHVTAEDLKKNLDVKSR
jgi:type 1 glutamine amidotransferase